MIVLNNTDEESRCLLQDNEGSREFSDNGGGGESDGGVDTDGENDRDGGEGCW